MLEVKQSQSIEFLYNLLLKTLHVLLKYFQIYPHNFDINIQFFFSKILLTFLDHCQMTLLYFRQSFLPVTISVWVLNFEIWEFAMLCWKVLFFSHLFAQLVFKIVENLTKRVITSHFYLLPCPKEWYSALFLKKTLPLEETIL